MSNKISAKEVLEDFYRALSGRAAGGTFLYAKNEQKCGIKIGKMDKDTVRDEIHRHIFQEFGEKAFLQDEKTLEMGIDPDFFNEVPDRLQKLVSLIEKHKKYELGAIAAALIALSGTATGNSRVSLTFSRYPSTGDRSVVGIATNDDSLYSAFLTAAGRLEQTFGDVVKLQTNPVACTEHPHLGNIEELANFMIPKYRLTVDAEFFSQQKNLQALSALTSVSSRPEKSNERGRL